MLRLSSVLFVLILSTPLLAQSNSNELNAPPDPLRSVTTYCDTVEHDSESQVPRIFVRPLPLENHLAGSDSTAGRRGVGQEPRNLWH